MATYTITPRPDEDRFDVQIVGSDGVRQTMLGFQSKADAEAWIVEDQQSGASDNPGGFRLRWRF